MITLSKDNKFGSFDNGSKRSVRIDKKTLTYEVRSYFNWRTPTKRYNTFIERFYGLGSYDYDNFINHLIRKGYWRFPAFAIHKKLFIKSLYKLLSKFVYIMREETKNNF